MLPGDTHGTFERFREEYFPEQATMTKDDYVIICGDFGGVWDGGKQENGIHPGTENVQSICGFGMAADQAAYKLIDKMEAAIKLKTYLIELLSNELKDICINSPPNSSPYILNFSFPRSNSVDIIRYLSLNEIYVSSASSCTKGKESHVLKAMGLAKNIINSSIRIGLSKYTTSKDIETLVDTLRLYQNQL